MDFRDDSHIGFSSTIWIRNSSVALWILQPRSFAPELKGGANTFHKRCVRDGTVFIDEVRAKKSMFPHLYRLIENQAGSASNIAEFISTFTLGQKSNRYFKAKQGVLSEDSIRDVIDGSKISIAPGDVIASLRAIVSQAEMSNRKKRLGNWTSCSTRTQ